MSGPITNVCDPSVLMEVFRSSAGSLKNMDIAFGCDRSLIKFFTERIPCSCLDDIHAAAKLYLPKISLCDHCGIKSERRSMLWCSKCRAFQFCSRENVR